MKRTALYEVHKKLNAKITNFGGYQMPLRYIGENTEHINVRTKVGLFDVSHMGKFFVRGENAEQFLNFVLTNDVSRLQKGKAQYTLMCNPRGGTIDDLIAYNLGNNTYLLIVNASNTEKDWQWLNKFLPMFPNTTMEDKTDEYSLLALSGPYAPTMLKKHIDVDVENMPYYSITEATLGGLKVYIATTGYTGERTFEIMINNAHAEELWNFLLDVGQSYFIQPAGLGARDTLRTEMGYPLYGNELTQYISPLEANLKFAVRLKKDNFIGKHILTAEYHFGVEKKLCGVITIDRGIPRKGMIVYDENGEQIIGEVTSGTYSPTLRDGIGLAYIKTSLAKEGNICSIIVRNKVVKMKIVSLPFVKNTSLQIWLMKRKK